MKRFNLRGNTANWSALKVEALNTKTEERETRSEIPYGHKVVVRVVDNYYRVYDKRVRQILHGEMSEKDTAEILKRLTANKRPDFILFHDGKVVGTANIHRRHWFRKQQEEPKLKTFNLEIGMKAKIEVEAYSQEEAEQLVYDAVERANHGDQPTFEVTNIEVVQ